MSYLYETLAIHEPAVTPVRGDDLWLSDLKEAAASCFLADPGPDPTYDPDPIPELFADSW